MTMNTDPEKMPDMSPDALEDFFAAARRSAPEPGADLLARVQADALALQPRPGLREEAGARPGLLAQLAGVFGGWPALAGMTAAAVTGLWVGVAPPTGLADGINAMIYGTETLSVDPLGAFDFVLMEG